MLQKRGKYEIPSSIPSDAADLIRKALQVDPNKRITAQAFLDHEWFVKNGIVKPKQVEIPQTRIPNNFTFKQIPDTRYEYSGISPPSGHRMQRSQSTENPLMRKLTPNNSRSVSRDITLKEPNLYQQNHLSQEDMPASFIQEPFYQSAQHNQYPGSPPAQVHSQQHISSYNFNNQRQQPMSPSNNLNLLQAHPVWQNKTNYLDYRISNNTSHDLKTNISTEIYSNDQSRIKTSSALKLKTGSNEVDKSQNSDILLPYTYKLTTQQVAFDEIGIWS